ncbi:MAG: UDP-N-acetylenolpyruvoylglucosamine reductase, partial [Olsenella sp.]
GHATSKDVHAVIEHVQDEVLKQSGVFLEPEVRFL